MHVHGLSHTVLNNFFISTDMINDSIENVLAYLPYSNSTISIDKMLCLLVGTVELFYVAK